MSRWVKAKFENFRLLLSRFKTIRAWLTLADLGQLWRALPYGCSLKCFSIPCFFGKIGNVFTPVCHSVDLTGCLPQCMLGYTPQADTPWQTPPGQTPPWADTPCGGHCSGRYAFYWNAFLSVEVLHLVHWSGNTSDLLSYMLSESLLLWETPEVMYPSCFLHWRVLPHEKQ